MKLLKFARQAHDKPVPLVRPCWKIIVADDDPAVHDVTELALTGFEFEGAGLEFIRCFSGADAVQAVAANPDAAVLLIDVVMERIDAGLEAVRVIRTELENTAIRIVVRTGHPGSASEATVVRDHDINDYREKSELTSQRLHMLMLSCLRNYRDLGNLHRMNRALTYFMETAPELFQVQALSDMAVRALEKLERFIVLLGREGSSEDFSAAVVRYGPGDTAGTVLESRGRFSAARGETASSALPNTLIGLIERTAIEGDDDTFAAYRFAYADGSEIVLVYERPRFGSLAEVGILRAFCRNIGVALDNVLLLESDTPDQT